MPNDLAQMDGLTDSQLGLLVRLLSLPPGWETTTTQLAQPGDGRDKIRSGLKALESLGLVRREQYRDESGRYRARLVVRDSLTGTESQAPTPDEAPDTGTESQASTPGTSPEIPSGTGTDFQAQDGFSGPVPGRISRTHRDGFSGPYIQATNTTTGDTGVAAVGNVTRIEDARPPTPDPGPEPPRTCPAHELHPSPPPCRPCGDARQAHERWIAARARRREWVEREHSRRLRAELEEADRHRARDTSKHMEAIRAALSTPKQQPCYNESTHTDTPEKGTATMRQNRTAG